jgi:hypothetical protein
LQLVQLLWIQPRNQDFEPAACIFYKEVVLFSNQVPIIPGSGRCKPPKWCTLH